MQLIHNKPALIVRLSIVPWELSKCLQWTTSFCYQIQVEGYDNRELVEGS